jgi:hypothetical protein
VQVQRQKTDAQRRVAAAVDKGGGLRGRDGGEFAGETLVVEINRQGILIERRAQAIKLRPLTLLNGLKRGLVVIALLAPLPGNGETGHAENKQADAGHEPFGDCHCPCH